MKKWVCSICGYVYEGESAPEQCPICKAPADKFVEQSGELVFADEHRVGVAKGADPRIIEGFEQPLHGRMHGSRYVPCNEPPGRPRRLS